MMPTGAILDWYRADTPSADRSSLTGLGLFAAAYLACAEVGRFLAFQGSAFATFWPPSGLLLGALVSSVPQVWPRFLLASLAANLTSDAFFHGKSFAVALAFWTGNAAAG